MSKNKKVLYQIIICALFAALAFVGTLVQIPLPSGGMIHLGNFVCVLGALLCGPIIGGLAGGIGCGLYDLIIYNSLPGFFQYFLLKGYFLNLQLNLKVIHILRLILYLYQIRFGF